MLGWEDALLTEIAQFPCPVEQSLLGVWKRNIGQKPLPGTVSSQLPAKSAAGAWAEIQITALVLSLSYEDRAESLLGFWIMERVAKS